jgi:hypothetical protein
VVDDAPRKLVELGTLPVGYGDVYIDANSLDPITTMVRDADRRLAAEKVSEAKRLAAEIADAERAQRTSRARVVRRFQRALASLMRV